MSHMEQDLRPVRTKRLLTEALVALSAHKSMLKIAVSELSHEAGINRATFYRHYASVPAFVDELIDDLLDGLVETHELGRAGEVEERDYYRSWLEFARGRRELFSALLSENGAPEFRHRLIQNGVDAWSYILRPGRVADLDEVQGGYIATYVTSAHVGVLTRWLENGCAESLDTMCSLLHRLSVQGALAACGLTESSELPY